MLVRVCVGACVGVCVCVRACVRACVTVRILYTCTMSKKNSKDMVARNNSL